jgi:hypothetical protein
LNVNDVLIRILKKDQHRNEEEKHVPENITRDREVAEKLQEKSNSEDTEKRTQENIAGEAQDQEILKPEQLKQVEIPVNSQTEVERWHLSADELKKIEKETKDRKSELERLRVAVRELEEANDSAEEEIAQLKQALAAKEDNQRSNKIQVRSSENLKKGSRHVHWQEELEGNFIVKPEEASSEEEEERPVRRSSREGYFGVTKGQNGTAFQKLSSASLRASVQETVTEDDYEEDDYYDAPLPASPPRKSRKVECKSQTSSAWGTLPLNVDDDLTAQFQGGLGRSRSSSRSGSGQSLLSDIWFFLTSLRAPAGCHCRWKYHRFAYITLR